MMISIKTLIPTAVVIGVLLTATAYAQDAASPASANTATTSPATASPVQEKETPPAQGTAEHTAQLQREHQRAVAAGDHANDPLNPASSNDLNKQELAKALALGTAPVPAEAHTASPPDQPPTALPDAPPQGPGVAPPPPDTAPPPTGDSLKPDTSTVK